MIAPKSLSLENHEVRMDVDPGHKTNTLFDSKLVSLANFRYFASIMEYIFPRSQFPIEFRLSSDCQRLAVLTWL